MKRQHRRDEPHGREMRVAVIGGLVTATFLFAMVIGAGRIGSFEALGLIEAVLPTARFLGSTVVAAAVTVLALMLTLVGLSLTSEYNFSPRLYTTAMSITRIAVACLYSVWGSCSQSPSQSPR